MRLQKLELNSTVSAQAGHYLLGRGFTAPSWYFFTDAQVTLPTGPQTTHGHLRRLGYTHYCPGNSLVADLIKRPGETVPKHSFDELNEAHMNLLVRLAKEEVMHEAKMKKLKERIQELELHSSWNSNIGVILSGNRYDDLLRCEGHLRDRTAERDASRLERDLARKTLDEVRALLNGQKLTP